MKTNWMEYKHLACYSLWKEIRPRVSQVIINHIARQVRSSVFELVDGRFTIRAMGLEN